MTFCSIQRTLPCQACASQPNGHCEQRHNWWDGARRDQCQKPWSGYSCSRTASCSEVH